MNKKLIYGIIAVVSIVVIAVVIWLFAGKKGNKQITLDLQTLNTSLAQTGNFDKMATMDITKEVATSIYQIEDGQIEEIIGKMPMMNVQASMYVVIKASEGNVQKVEEKIKAYGQAYEEQWERYLPAQYELVKDRKVGTKGNYVYMIVSENAQAMEDLMK